MMPSWVSKIRWGTWGVKPLGIFFRNWFFWIPKYKFSETKIFKVGIGLLVQASNFFSGSQEPLWLRPCWVYYLSATLLKNLLTDFVEIFERVGLHEELIRLWWCYMLRFHLFERQAFLCYSLCTIAIPINSEECNMKILDGGLNSVNASTLVYFLEHWWQLFLYCAARRWVSALSSFVTWFVVQLLLLVLQNLRFRSCFFV